MPGVEAYVSDVAHKNLLGTCGGEAFYAVWRFEEPMFGIGGYEKAFRLFYEHVVVFHYFGEFVPSDVDAALLKLSLNIEIGLSASVPRLQFSDRPDQLEDFSGYFLFLFPGFCAFVEGLF